jgi:hypothetical protein
MTTFAPLTFFCREMFPFDSGKIPIEKTGMMALVVALLWVIVALLWVMTERISF